MIFSSVNEDGIKAWELVLDGRKTVTRRLKPQPIGAIRKVQPKRTESAMCIRALTCELNNEYCDGNYTKCEQYEAMRIEITDCQLQANIDYPNHNMDKALEREANLEGLKSWDRLERYFRLQNIDINDTYRIEFKLKR
jgi:hypothetical protein